ncbi:MAG: YrrS family protein [Sporolactobacillus sp.]
MRSQRGDGSSRMERRKGKADRILKWIIAAVSLLILAVGCAILISVFRAAAPSAGSSVQRSSSTASHTVSSSSSKSGKKKHHISKKKPSSSSALSQTTADADHQASYDEGSADWNAQVTAIAKATGLDQSQMTILWLGNGGAQNSSLARVCPKGQSSQVYVVHLIYAGGKWQADNVKKPS